MLDNKDNKELIDSDLISLIICDIVQLKAKELLPLVKPFFDNGLVCIGICGDYENVKDDTINRPEKNYYKYELFNIYDRYKNVLTTWAGYTEKEGEDEEPDYGELKDYDLPAFQQEELLRSELKVGRNSPCPCGSGKKYKKCCGNR